VILILVATAWSLGIDLSDAYSIHHRIGVPRQIANGASLIFAVALIVFLAKAKPESGPFAQTRFALALWFAGGTANLLSTIAFVGCVDFIPLPLGWHHTALASPGDLIIFTSVPLIVRPLLIIVAARWRELATVPGRRARLRAVLSSRL